MVMHAAAATYSVRGQVSVGEEEVTHAAALLAGQSIEYKH